MADSLSSLLGDPIWSLLPDGVLLDHLKSCIVGGFAMAGLSLLLSSALGSRDSA